jgi:hypothetical protein
MTVAELMEKLKEFDSNMKVCYSTQERSEEITDVYVDETWLDFRDGPVQVVKVY